MTARLIIHGNYQSYTSYFCESTWLFLTCFGKSNCYIVYILIWIFYFFLKINKLLSIEIWRDAATQVFYSLGIGFGSILMYSSYNNPNFKCKTAAVCYGLVDTTVAICSCIIVFSLRGFQAHIKDDECMDKGLNQTLAQDEGFHDCNNSFLSQPVCIRNTLSLYNKSVIFKFIEMHLVLSSFRYQTRFR